MLKEWNKLTFHNFSCAKIAKCTWGKSSFKRFNFKKNTQKIHQQKVPWLAGNVWRPFWCQNEAHDDSLESSECLLSENIYFYIYLFFFTFFILFSFDFPNQLFSIWENPISSQTSLKFIILAPSCPSQRVDTPLLTALKGTLGLVEPTVGFFGLEKP